MKITGMNIAVIPAKANSSRCPEKNWREFYRGMNLVNYLLAGIPQSLFSRIIISTDKKDWEAPEGITLHRRDSHLSTVESPVNDLIASLIDLYQVPDDAYIWLLNPTSPFRERNDYNNILEKIEQEKPVSIISVIPVNPFLWRNSEAMFKTSYPRVNTQDASEEFALENGQFYVFKVGFFKKTKTWYSEKTLLYKQYSLGNKIDIDTEKEFSEAKNWAGVLHEKK